MSLRVCTRVWWSCTGSCHLHTHIFILACKWASQTCMPAAQSRVHAGRKSISVTTHVFMNVCLAVWASVQQCIYIPWPLCMCVHIHLCAYAGGAFMHLCTGFSQRKHKEKDDVKTPLLAMGLQAPGKHQNRRRTTVLELGEQGK